MTKKELLAVPPKKWDEALYGVRGVYVLPSRRKHDSGWACMDFVAVFADDRPMIRFGGGGGGCDDVGFYGNGFSMDCTYPHGIIHIWNRRNTFSVSQGISSIDFVEEKKQERDPKKELEKLERLSEYLMQLKERMQENDRTDDK